MTQKKVLIVGGGFGGVKAALILSNDNRFEVTLITKSQDLVFYPTLYEMVTSHRDPNSLIPIKNIFENRKINLIFEEAKELDRNNKTLKTTNGGQYVYDILILALGVVTNYFGIPGLKENSFSIKNFEEINRFKAHLHKEMVEEQKLDSHYLIIGAGPTGIELAGTLPEYLKQLSYNHGLKGHKPKITLVEAAPKLLPNLPKDVSTIIKKRLTKLGVNIITKAAIKRLDDDQALIGDKIYKTKTVVWTAGVSNNPFFILNNFSILTRGKVAVNTYLSTERDIYVIGDNADTPYSGMAQTAIWDAEFVANNLIRMEDSKEPKSYKARKPITIIPVGHKWAALVWKNIKIYGYLGWLLRGSADIIGFHDLEAWDKVTKQIIGHTVIEEECPVCNIAKMAKNIS